MEVSRPSHTFFNLIGIDKTGGSDDGLIVKSLHEAFSE